MADKGDSAKQVTEEFPVKAEESDQVAAADKTNGAPHAAESAATIGKEEEQEEEEQEEEEQDNEQQDGDNKEEEEVTNEQQEEKDGDKTNHPQDQQQEQQPQEQDAAEAEEEASAAELPQPKQKQTMQQQQQQQQEQQQQQQQQQPSANAVDQVADQQEGGAEMGVDKKKRKKRRKNRRKKKKQQQEQQQQQNGVNGNGENGIALRFTKPAGASDLDDLGGFGREHETTDERRARLKRMQRAVRELLVCLGEDPSRPGLLDTPRRVAKALDFMTRGYTQIPGRVIRNAIFPEDHDDMVIVKDIEFFSMCEHHMVPFFGKVHIGYLPRKKVLGLSKFARVVEVFSRRLQVQERLTKQIAEVLMEVLNPTGCAVIVEAQHMCMLMRGVQKTQTTTTTSTMLGTFRVDARTRDEFLRLLYRG
ncbi:GTP cyclohydrolase I [Salpingoeca rosetta]|uniref:GTP cyclohydrolase 1 n=1 Tax=Salpingoeca rosetta (strain ATCC 50818 / BSB-021) TaxID=946362 RepID=F2UPA3_SALR5|nr:GTP cyclohydrolase I [Salpingoeca rosetta]EGD79458.1 GTP cyclohydrolase I [Salpingoeca rosetta]|eukprot:XP_004988939.1 GTP cyclohydrolase I [Salpingoeca rosetta]